MGEKMTPIPLRQLLSWALKEYKANETVFGINRFYKKSNDKALSIFGEKLDLPFGPCLLYTSMRITVLLPLEQSLNLMQLQ